MPFQPGQILLNKYRIENLLGEGAFGEVYLATHLQLGAKRALKVLRRDAPGMGSTLYQDYQERFQREAQLGAHIDDNNVIRVYDLEQLDKGGFLLVMEYAPGDTLRRRLERARENKTPLSVEEAVRITLDIALGLNAIHALDVVHRDIKPSNIYLDENGRAKIGDLGLAQIPGGYSHRSQMGSITPPHPGTPAYMSPEQVATTDYLPPASDIYALGIVLFEMLTLRSYRSMPPGTQAGSLRKDIPKSVDALLGRMLVKDPEKRTWNGENCIREIEQAVKTIRQGWAAKIKATAGHRQPASKLSEDMQSSQEGRLPKAPQAGTVAYSQAAAGGEKPAEFAGIPQAERSGGTKPAVPRPGWLLWLGGAGLVGLFGLGLIIVIMLLLNGGGSNSRAAQPAYESAPAAEEVSIYSATVEVAPAPDSPVIAEAQPVAAAQAAVQAPPELPTYTPYPPQPTYTELPTQEPPPTQRPPTEAPPVQSSSPYIYFDVNTYCRQQAYSDADWDCYYNKGDTAEIYGRDSTSTWWVVTRLDKPGRYCWVYSKSVNGDISGLDVYSRDKSW